MEENLLRLGKQQLGDSGNASWNAEDFCVFYPSLSHHMIVGGVFINLLVESNDPEVLELIQDPKEVFMAAYLAFLKTADSSVHRQALIYQPSEVIEEQCICTRAMSKVYGRYCSKIGQFREFEHILALFANTSSRTLRHSILNFMQTLVSPLHSEEDHVVKKIAKQNAAELCRFGGVVLLCDAVATSHEASVSMPLVAKDTLNPLLTSFKDSNETKLWFYGDITQENVPSMDANVQILQAFDQIKDGPVSKKEIKRLFRSNRIMSKTHLQRIGMKFPKPLMDIREMCWWCAEGTPIMSPLEFARTALEVLSRIVALFPAIDEESGNQLLPLPLAHRQLSQSSSISRIAQAVLTNDSELVSRSVLLLRDLATQNAEVMKRLYSSGIFFFLLSYSGSDLDEISSFFKETHLHQKFKGSLGNSSSQAVSLSGRSVLGDFLPG